MNDIPPRQRQAHLLTVTALVFLEYLQSVMASFSSRYIMGGIEAAPEEFSLAAAAYAGVAVVMLFKHRVLVQRWGYRRFIRFSLLVFALGALMSGLASDAHRLLAGHAPTGVSSTRPPPPAARMSAWRQVVVCSWTTSARRPRRSRPPRPAGPWPAAAMRR